MVDPRTDTRPDTRTAGTAAAAEAGGLRRIADGMDPATVAAIDRVLDGVAAEHGVAIPLAVESGSRAWGFPSPDSDYDCRFLTVRPVRAHLTPWPPRDVIEVPPDGDLDVSGWDLAKALALMLKGNAVVIEWLTSPIVYRGEAWFRDRLLTFAGECVARERVILHYLHLGERQRRAYFADVNAVPLKKLFYALRPAASLRWLALHPGAAVAPMHFPTLMAECDPPSALTTVVADLIAEKARTRELGVAPLPAPVAAFVDQEYARARAVEPTLAPGTDAANRQAASALYREIVERLDGARAGETPPAGGRAA